MIASLAVETGIAPSQLMQESPRMLWTIAKYLRWKAIRENPTPYDKNSNGI